MKIEIFNEAQNLPEANQKPFDIHGSSNSTSYYRDIPSTQDNDHMTHRTINHMQSMTFAYDETNQMLHAAYLNQCHDIRPYEMPDKI